METGSKEKLETPAEKEFNKMKLMPKRPLTPFLLFRETERPTITDYLGPNAARGAVSTEGTKRWSALTSEEKGVCFLPAMNEKVLTVSALDQQIQRKSPPLQCTCARLPAW
jgi:HMG (high mobility group) box